MRRDRIGQVLSYLVFKVLSQGMAFASGLLCIRAISVHQFGIYSIATVMIAVIGVIAESGTSSTLLRRASHLVSAEDQSEQIRAAIAVKSRVTVIVSVPCTALLVGVLLLNGEPPLQILLITALVIANIGPTLSSSIFLVGLQVTDRFRAIRWLDLGNSALRLVLIAAAWAAGVGSVGLLLAISLASIVAQRAVEAVILRPYLRGARTSDEQRSTYWTAIKQTLPTSVMMVVGEQLVIVVLTIAGNVAAIGQISALGKFAAAFTVLNSLLMTVIAPMLARFGTGGAARLRQGVLGVLGVYVVVALAYVGGSALFEPLLLGLLGPGYQQLGPELVIISAGVALSNFATFGLGSINHARGWLRFSWTYVPALGLWLLLVLVLPLDTPFGAAIFSASLSVPVAISQAWRLAAGWRRLRHEEDQPTRASTPAEV